MNIFLKNSKREKKVSYSNRNTVLPIEKVVAILSYFTFGFVGFIWIIIGAFLKQSLRPFIKYHIFQSIFLAILFFIVSHVLIFVMNVLAFIPILNILMSALAYATSVAIINIAWIHLSIVQIIILAVTIYLSAGVLKGQYSYVPWVSEIIKYNINRS